MNKGMDFLVAFCNSASQPVSAFRQDYTHAASGVINGNVSTVSNEISAPAPSRDR
jgi:hypothetical protein